MIDPDYDIFFAVVEQGSLSAAGRRLGLSPAMVSKRLARLEARLGVRLLHRTTRRIALTVAGERFHADLAPLLARLEEAERRVLGGAGRVAGTLRVSAPTSFGRLHLAPHLAPFLDAHPRLALTLDLSDGYADLIGERIDVAVRIGSDMGRGVVAHRLATSARLLCAAPAYGARLGFPEDARALAAHRLLAADGQWPWLLVGPRGVVAVEGPSHVRTNSSEVVRELTLAGVGIALRSLWDVAADLAAGRLVRVLPDLRGSTEVGVFAVRPPAPEPPPAAAAFIAFLGDLYRAPPWADGGAAMPAR